MKYTVVKGDTLSLIAQRIYGNLNRWPEIWNANRSQIENPALIYPGQVLTIPNVTTTTATTGGTTGGKPSGIIGGGSSGTIGEGPSGTLGGKALPILALGAIALLLMNN